MQLAERLLDVIRTAAGDRTAYVCYSGGIDSTVVLAASVETSDSRDRIHQLLDGRRP